MAGFGFAQTAVNGKVRLEEERGRGLTKAALRLPRNTGFAGRGGGGGGGGGGEGWGVGGGSW